MSFFSTFIKDIENVPGEVAKFFSAHQVQIQSAISDAQTAVSAATGVAAILEPAAVAPLILVANGLTKVSSAVTAESTAVTLNSQASALGALVSDLVTSGDVGVKNASVKTAVTNAVTKAQTVVGALVTAVSVAPASAA